LLNSKGVKIFDFVMIFIIACERDVNGCGSGFTESLPLMFRPQITPSCNKHDVCYDCVSILHFTS